MGIAVWESMESLGLWDSTTFPFWLVQARSDVDAINDRKIHVDYKSIQDAFILYIMSHYEVGLSA